MGEAEHIERRAHLKPVVAVRLVREGYIIIPAGVYIMLVSRHRYLMSRNRKWRVYGKLALCKNWKAWMPGDVPERVTILFFLTLILSELEPCEGRAGGVSEHERIFSFLLICTTYCKYPYRSTKPHISGGAYAPGSTPRKGREVF